MPVRRCSDPAWVQQIWDAVRYTAHQRQQCDITRITRYLQRVHEHPPILSEQHVRQLIKDKLLISENRIAKIGPKMGTSTECFRIPPQDSSTPDDDGHDWYCIECHLAGDVICCSTCHRVFHLSCHKEKSLKKNESQKKNNTKDIEITEDEEVVVIKETENEKEVAIDKEPVIDKETEIKEPVNDSEITNNKEIVNDNEATKDSDPLPPKQNSDVVTNIEDVTVISEDDVSSSAEEVIPTVCSVCQLLQKEDDCVLSKDEMNYLLNFTLNRIKIWLAPNITDSMAPRDPNQSWINEQELRWRATQLLYQTMDIRIMEMKLRTKEYTKLVQFHADIITIQHNVAIFHGKDSQELEGSRIMLHDCIYDLVELAQCIDCYRHSNEKSSSRWFCIPCKPAHELVWAKQKGYSYWPAKVIKKTAEHYDVRFFGAKHSRSIIDKNYIQPIEATIQSLHIKRTSAFNKAYEELELHQTLLKNPDEVAKLLARADMKQNNSRQSLPGSAKKKSSSKKRKLSVDNDVYELNDDSVLDTTNNGSLTPNITPKLTSTPASRAKTPRSTKKSNKRSPVTADYNIKSNDVTEEPELEKTNGNKDCDIIDISDGETKAVSTPPYEGRQDYVSSSTENMIQPTLSVEKTPRSRDSRRGSSVTQHLDRVYSEVVEKVRRQLDNITDREELVRIALDGMQQEVDKIQNAQAEQLRQIVDAHNVHVSEIKKKQWCYNCEQEAIYHCCWNTAYCSTTCQQQHWQTEHKKVCRRKR